MPVPASQADRLFALGSQNHQAGRLAAAEQQYQEALKLASTHVGSLYSLGIIGLQTGRYDMAAELIGKALALHGGEPDWHYNLGLALERLGRSADAVAHHRRAIELNPNHVNAINHLGIVAAQGGRTAEATAHFRRALAIDAQHIPTLNSLGNLLASTGVLDEAATIFETIIRNRPNPVAYENLALTLLLGGDPVRAASVLQQGSHSAMTPKMQQLFLLCAPNLLAGKDDPGLRDLTRRALAETWGPPTALADLAASLVKIRADTAASLARAATAWPRRLPAAELFGPSGLAAIAGDALLLGLIERTQATDVELERFLTVVRAALLGLADCPDPTIDPNALRLLVAVARQCFINEYVFAATPEEEERIRSLRDRLALALQSGAQPPAHWVAAVASYLPLHTVPKAKSLLDSSWPAPVHALLVEQVQEPLEEQELRSAIPRLTPIEDRVSQRVREQYEENPYPRNAAIVVEPPCVNLDEHVRNLFPHAPYNSLGPRRDPDILIAGCGTGPAVVAMAQLFPASRILAIDLSLASLAYAQRRTRNAGFKNVEFAQADILQIGAIGRSFDLIESHGVLHHMEDPLAGWRALLSVLRPNGLMALGLYSELARKYLAPGRELIAEDGYQSNAGDIRRFRQALIEHGDRARFDRILTSADFFTTSTCRDLLFHVQEHRFTLPQIDAFLKSNRLRLLGIELPPADIQRYASRYPQNQSRTNLDLWNEFENENPELFRAMYQFWVQRVD